MFSKKIAVAIIALLVLVLGGCAANNIATTTPTDTPMDAAVNTRHSSTERPALTRGETVSLEVNRVFGVRIDCTEPVEKSIRKRMGEVLQSGGYRIGSKDSARYSIVVDISACGPITLADAKKNVDAGYKGEVFAGYQGPYHILDTAVLLLYFAVTGPAPEKDWVYRSVTTDITVTDTKDARVLYSNRMVVQDPKKLSNERWPAFLDAAAQGVSELFR